MHFHNNTKNIRSVNIFQKNIKFVLKLFFIQNIIFLFKQITINESLHLLSLIKVLTYILETTNITTESLLCILTLRTYSENVSHIFYSYLHMYYLF